MKKLLFSFIGIALIAVVLSGCVFNKEEGFEESVLGGESEAYVDLIGSRTGTTTTYVLNSILQASTSTKTILLGANIDTIDLNIYVKNASSTNQFNWNVLQSSDLACNTTETSGVDIITTDDINWSDALPYSVDALVESYTSPTTSFKWIAPATGRYGITQKITDWNANCLRIDYRGASTTIYANIKAKELR